MAEIKLVANGLDPDDLWKNLFWLRDRIEKLEATVRLLEARPTCTHHGMGGVR